MFYRFVNWYAQRFSFPPRGYQVFLSLLKKTGNEQKRFQKKLHNGLLIHVYPLRHIDRILFWHGYYEKKFVLLLEELLKEDDVFVDIGANIGYYSLIASKKAVKGLVFAFEPFSGNRSELEDNISLNRINNIQVSALAISNEKTSKTLFVSANDNTGMTGFQKPSNFNGAIETIHTITLDEWAKENHIDRINMIKIDIEGAEYEALEGISNVLTEMKPVVMIEIQASLLAKYKKQPGDIYRFMKNHGYRSFEVVSKNQLKEIDAEWEDELVLFAPEGYAFPSHIIIQSN